VVAINVQIKSTKKAKKKKTFLKKKSAAQTGISVSGLK
jgi:hypothetical protein